MFRVSDRPSVEEVEAALENSLRVKRYVDYVIQEGPRTTCISSGRDLVPGTTYYCSRSDLDTLSREFADWARDGDNPRVERVFLEIEKSILKRQELSDTQWGKLNEAIGALIESCHKFLRDQCESARHEADIWSLVGLAADLKTEELKLRERGSPQRHSTTRIRDQVPPQSASPTQSDSRLSFISWLLSVGLGMLGAGYFLEMVFRAPSSWYKPFVIMLSSAFIAWFLLIHARFAEVAARRIAPDFESVEKEDLDGPLTLLMKVYVGCIPELERRKAIERNLWIAAMIFGVLAALSLIYGIGRPFAK